MKSGLTTGSLDVVPSLLAVGEVSPKNGVPALELAGVGT